MSDVVEISASISEGVRNQLHSRHNEPPSRFSTMQAIAAQILQLDHMPVKQRILAAQLNMEAKMDLYHRRIRQTDDEGRMGEFKQYQV